MRVLEAIRAVVGAGAVFEGESIDQAYLADWVVPMAGGRPLGLVKPVEATTT